MAEAGYGDAMAGPPEAAASSVERVFPCVKLRGLPFDVNEEEIRAFLVRPKSRIQTSTNAIAIKLESTHKSSWRGPCHAACATAHRRPAREHRAACTANTPPPPTRSWTRWTFCWSSATGASLARCSSCWAMRLTSRRRWTRTSPIWAAAMWRSSAPKSW